ncbi:MAG TPA: S1/P1 nuclease [Thermoanaerobaculia bacterium]|nr:S1/P1 nuclease [Thermoanaerobaculia bacterium]
MHHPKRRLGWLFLALLILGLALPAPTLAWGGGGHRIIARLALRQIRREAEAGDRDARLVRKIVYQAIATDSTATLESAAVFPDVVRGKDPYKFADSWHFVSIPRSSSAYDAATQCVVKPTAPEGDCAVGGIAHFRKALLAERGVANKAALDAVSFIIHFIGDIHQPLHASEDLDFIHDGRPGDRGGNFRPVCFLRVSENACTQLFNGERSSKNLHATWDKFMIIETGKDDDAFVNELDARILALDAATKAAWAEGDPAKWTEEAHALAAQHVYTPQLLRDIQVPHPRQFADFYFVDREYQDANIVRIEEQLVKASVRLAGYLKQIAHELP